MDKSVQITLISTIGGIIIAFIANRAKNQKSESAETVDSALQVTAYEDLIRKLYKDLESRDKTIMKQNIELNKLKERQ